MSYTGLKQFVKELEKRNDLIRIDQFVDPDLEITEITDRMSKAGGKALLFENNGTGFPVLINAFGSDARMSMAIGRNNLEEAGAEIEALLKNKMTEPGSSFLGKLSALPLLVKLGGILPSRIKARGRCQQNIIRDPDLSILPVLKCWPHDGGRFVTLPMVHTRHPLTGSTNVGMYRMQLLNKNTTGMHWQRHKTGAAHFEAWKKTGVRMPVSVALGGDPVYAYSATAPLPENVDEYILAGFLRKKKVRLVRCITNDLWVPEDCDIIIEGYVDPAEDLVWEGPFGDHTGFYSLADWYPKFHVTCITHTSDAIYPATIVGIPPMEDAFIAKATEKLFLAPIKMTLQPEIEDLHMPDAGVAHNCAIIKIRKNYPGQGMKVINALSGAGQMMFTKYMIVVDGDVNIRDYKTLAEHIFRNTDFSSDLLFNNGPLDVLDHSSDSFSFGGKMGIDATVKLNEEIKKRRLPSSADISAFNGSDLLTDYNDLTETGLPLIIVSVNMKAWSDAVSRVGQLFSNNSRFRMIIVVDHTVDVKDHFMVAWQLFGNTDPVRDHTYVSPGVILIDATIKFFRAGGFPRKWPNVVLSSDATIAVVNTKWHSLGLGDLIDSPSTRYSRLCQEGKDELKA
jgi:4-hydroxy-3-polyprenylbenzoate decarboxylase